MKKKLLILVLIVFSTACITKVKADDIISTANAIPGTGGNDPCYDYSYVCVYNLPGFRISYYNVNQVYQAGIDVYQQNVYNGDINNILNNITNDQVGEYLSKNRKMIPINNKKEMNLGIEVKNNQIPSFSTYSKQKEVYKQIIKKFDDRNFIMNLFNVLKLNNRSNWNLSEIESWVREHQSDYIMVEPLFLLRIQNIADAKNVYYNKAQPKFKKFIGTSYNIANQIVNGNPGANGDCTGENNNIYCSRKEKGHVSRMANSMRLKVGMLTISKEEKARKNETEMRQLANVNNGYGVSIFNLEAIFIDNPDIPNENTVCYKVNNDSVCRATENKIRINANVEQTKTSNDPKTCQKGLDDHTYSGSKNGVITDVGLFRENKYCSLYCNKDVEVVYPQGNYSGEIKGFVTFGNDTNSSLYNSIFSITVTGDMKCKAEPRYVYTNQGHNDITGEKYYDFDDESIPVNTKGISLMYDGNVTVAEKELYELYKTKPSKDQPGYDLWKQRWNTTWGDIELSYINCSNYIPVDDLTSDIEIKPSVKINNKPLELDETYNNRISSSVASGQTLSNEEYDSEGVKMVNDGSYGCDPDTVKEKYGGHWSLCAVRNYYEKKLMKYPAFDVDINTTYGLKQKSKFDLNKQSDVISNTSSSEKNYVTASNDPSVATKNVVGNVCPLESNQTTTINKITSNKEITNMNNNQPAVGDKIEITFTGAICENQKSEINIYNSTSSASECPPETLHAGTNVYYWAANNLLSGDLNNKFMYEGVTYSEAQYLVCNNETLPKFAGGYEQIIAGDEKTFIDTQLMSGEPFYEAYMNPKTYFCDNGTTNVDITEKVVKKVKELGIDDNAALEIVSKEYPCVCSEKSKPFIYRTISLDEKKISFPGKDGSGRTPGSNWSDSTIEQVINGTKGIYNKANQEPMYTIVLDLNTIKKIREYNKNHKYSDFNLDCDKNGAACVSKFLHEEGNEYISSVVNGKCSNVNKTNFYDSSCVNYMVGKGQ